MTLVLLDVPTKVESKVIHFQDNLKLHCLTNVVLRLFLFNLLRYRHNNPIRGMDSLPSQILVNLIYFT